ncbi:MAG: hypothetical protein JWO09_122 [Bacteroidetes bacterium]|nr:hypothetical protein [Bacteroidota bacterium]
MKTNYLLIPSALIILLSSCSTTMYVSNTVNVPLLNEKGEVKINVDQNDAQIAVAVGNHWGVMANGFYKSYESNENYTHQGNLAEAGFGYYKPFRNNLVFETYTGVGIGTIDKKQTFTASDNSVYWASFSAQGTKAFLQPSLGYCSRFFDLAFTPRLSFVKYTHFKSYGYTDAQLAEDYLDNNRLTNGIYMFAEPALTIRAGYKFVKVQAQYGLTMDLGPANIKHSPNFASIGLVIDIAKWYKGPGKEPGTK